MRIRQLQVLVTCFFLILTLSVVPSDSGACVYSSKVRSFNRAKAKYLLNPTAANLARMCRKQAAIAKKFPGRPGKPTPPLPPGAVCPVPGGGGGGRGGGPGGGGGGGGGGGAGPLGMPGLGPYPGILFIRNHNPFDCMFSWTVTADPVNPIGFSVAPAAGAEFVPAGTTVTIPFDATIDPGVTPGEFAFFDVDIVDTCAGLPLPDDFKRFKVTATPDISIVPVAPAAVVMDGVPFVVAWTITNQSAAPVVKTYSFTTIGDPQSVGELNDGTLYDVRNIFEVGPSPLGGGSVSLLPGESEDVNWGPLVSGMFCDPAMLGCCGIEIDGNESCIMVFNDDAGADREVERFFDLTGEAQGGFVEVQIDAFLIQVPTFPGDLIPQILDELALQMLNLAQVNPHFPFMPMVDETGMTLLRAEGIPVQFLSGDPGLEWVSFNLDPIISEGSTGEIHTVIVELTLAGTPVPGVPIEFFVDGANGPLGGAGPPTDAQGLAQFQYLGNNTGIDDVFAQTVFNGTELLELTSRFWDAPSAVPSDPVTTSTAILHAARPNPFSAPGTEIRFDLVSSDHARLRVYTPGGQTVRTLVDRRLEGGSHVFAWDGNADDGKPMPSGVYYYDLETEGTRQADRVVLIR